MVGFAALGPVRRPGRGGRRRTRWWPSSSIDPQAQRRGHGSRLLNACVDTLRADGFARATWWVRATDDVLRRFLTEAGWAADGAHTEVAVGEGGPRLKLVRLHTDIG